MGQTHARAWSNTSATIAGFLSRHNQSAAELSRTYGGRVFPDLPGLLAEVDVVDICTPTHLHHEMALAAAAAGKAIICEKPLARTLNQAQEIIAACKEAGVKLLVAHVVRFFPEYALAKAQVDAGEIGQPAVLRLRRGAFQPKKEEDNWFIDLSKSGGVILDMMIHDFDYARWVAGEVSSVFAKRLRANHPEAPVDHALVILTHENGAISHVEGSWAYPPPLFRTAIEIAGSNGWIQTDSEQHAAVKVFEHRRGDDAPDVPQPGSPLAEDPYTTQIRSFYDSLADDAPIAVGGHEGLAALQIALAAIESVETGQVIQLETLTA
jgi:predicted dehydrogenase